MLKALSQKKIRPVLSVPLLFEYEDVLKRNSRKLGITHEDIDSFLDNVCKLCTFHEIHYLWRPFLRDPKDDLNWQSRHKLIRSQLSTQRISRELNSLE